MELEVVWLVVGTGLYMFLCSSYGSRVSGPLLGDPVGGPLVGCVCLVGGWKFGWPVLWGPVRDALSNALPQQGTAVHHASTNVLMGLILFATAAALIWVPPLVVSMLPRRTGGPRAAS